MLEGLPCNEYFIFRSQSFGSSLWLKALTQALAQAFGSPVATLAQALAQGRLGSNPRGQVVCRSV